MKKLLITIAVVVLVGCGQNLYEPFIYPYEIFI
jgi:hypothetical protein